MSLTAFVVASLAFLLTPGPTNTLLAAAGAGGGIRGGVMLPAAEGIGYAVAIGAFLGATRYLSDVGFALPVLKATAAIWLLLSAALLWRQPVRIDATERLSAMRRVFLTTILNPKAMLVGTIVIPTLLPDQALLGLLCFVALSGLAGILWLTVGSMLPLRARPYAYQGAALILAAFSVAPASSSLAG